MTDVTRPKELVAAVMRLRYVLLTAAALAVALRTWHLRRNDFLFFEYFARLVLGRGPASIDSRPVLQFYLEVPTMQVGPPGLFAAVPFQLLPTGIANQAAAVFMMLCLVPAIALIERTARLVGMASRTTAPLTLVGGLAALPVWWDLAVGFMHLDDVLVILCVLYATGEVAKQRWLTASIALGTATATKPWAVAVLPLLLALNRPVLWKAGLAWIGTFLVWWAPFLVAAPGTFIALSAGVSPIHSGSTWHWLGVQGEPACDGPCGDVAYSWMRPLQFAVSFLLAAAVVKRGRWFAAPLVGLLGRVSLDTQVWTYYASGPVLMALLCDAVSGRRLPVVAVLVGAAEYAQLVVDSPTLQALIRLLVAGALIGWYLRPAKRPAEGLGDDAGRLPQTSDPPLATT